jgi:alkylation response protein AidB-like acyl-CoA dehydrogenase
VVTGEKPIVTGAVGADVYMVFVEEETSSDMAVVLLERGDGGVEVEPVDPMGVRALGLGTLRMRDVVVPASRMIVESDGLTFAQRMLNARRVLLAAGLVGGMRALHEHCVRQLAATCRYGVPLTDFPNVQAALGRQVVVVQTAQATLHQALSALDSGAADAAFDSCVSACKHAVTEAAVDLGISALRLLGGRGYLRGRAERFLRDACSMLSAAGAQDVLEVSLGLRAATAATRPRPPYGVTVPVQLVEAAR